MTCGSTLKLKHSSSSYRLHSHQVAYSRGSGQQSVTAYPNSDDAQSYWVVHGLQVSVQLTQITVQGVLCGQASGCAVVLVRASAPPRMRRHAAHRRAPPCAHCQHMHPLPLACTPFAQDKPCVPGSPIRKGSTLRLQHGNTRKWLHSHQYHSPISGGLEVGRVFHTHVFGMRQAACGMYRVDTSDAHCWRVVRRQLRYSLCCARTFLHASTSVRAFTVWHTGQRVWRRRPIRWRRRVDG